VIRSTFAGVYPYRLERSGRIQADHAIVSLTQLAERSTAFETEVSVEGTRRSDFGDGCVALGLRFIEGGPG